MNSLKMTLRIEPPCHVTPRIEPFENMTQRIELLFETTNMTQRIEPFSKKNSENWTLFEKKYDSKNTTFLTWLSEFESSLDESKKWTNVTPIIVFFECDFQ